MNTLEISARAMGLKTIGEDGTGLSVTEYIRPGVATSEKNQFYWNPLISPEQAAFMAEKYSVAIYFSSGSCTAVCGDFRYISKYETSPISSMCEAIVNAIVKSYKVNMLDAWRHEAPWGSE